MSAWVEVRAIKKNKRGSANHGDIIDLRALTRGLAWTNPKMTVTLSSLELEGNTQRVYCEATNLGNDRFEIIACSTTTTNLANIADEFVSTKYGSCVWFAFESD